MNNYEHLILGSTLLVYRPNYNTSKIVFVLLSMCHIIHFKLKRLILMIHIFFAKRIKTGACGLGMLFASSKASKKRLLFASSKKSMAKARFIK
jgi:hypothetical protein